MRYTEYHGGVAVIKDRMKHKEAMRKLAHLEDIEDIGCTGCDYEECMKALFPCRVCARCKEDKYVRSK